MIKKVIIEKEYIQFDDIKVEPPFTKEKMDAIFGVPEIEEKDSDIGNGRVSHSIFYRWNEIGISSYANKKRDYYNNLSIDLEKTEVEFPRKGFRKDEYDCSYVKKFGPFTLSTFFMEHIDEVKESERKFAEAMAGSIDIDIKNPRPKESIYDLKKSEEPVLKFKSFPFKLLVMEQLMYKKGLLLPKFDIYDFAENNTKREIDVDDEGYEPIPDAVRWFKNYEIPEKYADEITELLWDGGLTIFGQIYPDWDGEDDCFDIKSLSAEDVSQFKNLKKVTAVAGISKKAIKTLQSLGVDVQA